MDEAVRKPKQGGKKMDEDKKEYPRKEPVGGISTACGRMSAALIKDKIQSREREIASLQLLLDLIPWKELSKTDEEFLWNYFCTRY